MRHIDDRTHDGLTVGVENFFARFGIDGDLGGLPRFVNIFETDDGGGFSSDGGAISEPRGGATHELTNKARARSFAVGEKVAQFLGKHFDGAEVTEGEGDAFIVVVDRLGKVNDLDALGVGGLAIHIELELSRGGQGVVAADRDESVDSEGAKRLIDGFHRGGLFGIVEIFGGLERFSGVSAGGADADPLLRAQAVANALVETNVSFAFLENVAVVVFDEVGVTVEHTVNFDAGASKAKGCAADDGVSGGSGAAGEENSNFFDVRVRSLRTG